MKIGRKRHGFNRRGHSHRCRHGCGNVSQNLRNGNPIQQAFALGQIGGQDAPGLRVFLHLGERIWAKLLFTALNEIFHMRVILRFEFDSRAVAIDGADIYDGPDPGHDSSETESERSEAKLHDSLALIAGVKIMSAKKTDKRAGTDKVAPVFWFGVGSRFEV